MSTTLPRARRGVAFLATTAVLLTACGGTDEPDGIASGAPSSATEAPSEAPEAAPASDAPTQEPTPDPTPSPTEVGEHGEPHGELASAFGESRNLGPGRPVGITPDGAHVHVLAPHPTDHLTGCEGLERDVLWTVAVADGERRRAFAGLEDDGWGFGLPVAAPDGSGRVIMQSICEEHFGSAAIAQMSEDGTLSDVQELPYPGEDGDSERWLSAFSVQWTADGRLESIVVDYEADERVWYARPWDAANGAWGERRVVDRDDVNPRFAPSEPARDPSGHHEATSEWWPMTLTVKDTRDGRSATIPGAASPMFVDGHLVYALASSYGEQGWPVTDVVARPFG